MNAAHARALAEQLRQARDLMNDNGMHWIKGAESMLVDPETHVPGGHGEKYVYLARQNPDMQVGYCSIGALHEVSADLEATVTLAEVIDPGRMKQVRKSLKADAVAEYRYECEYGYREPDKRELEMYIQDYMDDRVQEEAEDVIVGFNDGTKTRWDDVRGAFTKAAKRLADRARRAEA